MVTDVRICNMALSHLGGRGTISSLSEASEEARQCALHFEAARDEALTRFPWPFAAKTRALALSGEAPPPDWRRSYEYPADCLAPRALLGGVGPDSPRFSVAVSEKLDRRVILADVEGPVLQYTARVTNPALFDPLFVSALALRLAALIAVPISGRVELSTALLSMYEREIDVAAAAALNDSAPRPYPDAEWIRARG